MFQQQYDSLLRQTSLDYLQLGKLSIILHHDWDESFLWFHKAYQSSNMPEPLVRIANYYSQHSIYGNFPDWAMCYLFARMACDLSPPLTCSPEQLEYYRYDRHHIFAKACYHVGRYDEGLRSCQIAIANKNREEDRELLKLYLDMQIEILESGVVRSPCLISATFNGEEMRTEEEVEHKFDRRQIITEIIAGMRMNPLTRLELCQRNGINYA